MTMRHDLRALGAPILAACLALGLALAAPAAAAGPGPEETLKKHIQEFVSYLQKPEFQKERLSQEQEDKLWAVIREAFDFQGVSRRAVGRGWGSFSAKQKQEFSRVFAQLLGHNYLQKIRKEYQNQKVQYTSAEQISDAKTVVHTEIAREGGNVPVDYSMWQTKKGWQIYDVKVEGVSLVQNYRAQFRQMLLNHDPAYLIQQVRKKVESQKR
jgi:phospholipid transport system substrate-binding protein